MIFKRGDIINDILNISMMVKANGIVMKHDICPQTQTSSYRFYYNDLCIGTFVLTETDWYWFSFRSFPKDIPLIYNQDWSSKYFLQVQTDLTQSTLIS